MNSREEGRWRLAGATVPAADPWFLHYRSLFADLEKASARAHGKMLDIGCGNKPFEKMFALNVMEHVGCDVVQSSGSRADVLCLATDLPFRDASYDTVLATQVIEHVADHKTMLGETFRVLRPGGTLILSGPMYWPLHEEPYDFFRFTEHGLRFLLKTTGFIDINITNNGGKWALCGQMLIHVTRNTRLERYRFFVRLVNRIFSHLDDRRPTRDNTMNYVATAMKAPAGGLEALP